jgi:predicted XRE-type DNA-binding protein
MSKAIKFTMSKNNLFADMGFSEEEAKELQFRSFLMSVIVRYIKLEGLTQKEAAKRLETTQSRISNLVRGKIDLFSASMLLAILEKAGFKIYENIQENAKDLFKYHDVNIFSALPKSNSNGVAGFRI